MKYAVLRISNGSFKLESPQSEDIKVVKDKYFEIVRSYYAQANIDAVVKIIDGNLDAIEGGKYTEHIHNSTEVQGE